WKPSEKAPLTALAVQALFERAARQFEAIGGSVPEGLSTLIIGGHAIGEVLVDHPSVPLISATGSTAMGRAIAPRLAQRFAHAILELRSNNGDIIFPSADLNLTLRAVAFAAMGIAGQRCTTLRRLFGHESIYEGFVTRLKQAYLSATVGNPLQTGTLVGPLIDDRAYAAMRKALDEAKSHGGSLTGGERLQMDHSPQAFYVRPALVEMPVQVDLVMRETFAPILYAMRYRAFDQALVLHNAVSQGLASSIFTYDVREAEAFLSAQGSDCGIANVNIGPSGAEI